MQSRIFITLVQDANPERHLSSLVRRCFKMLEEMGEIAQAYLDVTSAHPLRQKTHEDLREEMADTLIVALDIGLTELPGETVPQHPSLLSPRYLEPPITFAEKLFRVNTALSRLFESLAQRRWYEVRNYQNALMTTAYALAITPLDHETIATQDEIIARLEQDVRRKLAKWADQRAARAA